MKNIILAKCIKISKQCKILLVYVILWSFTFPLKAQNRRAEIKITKIDSILLKDKFLVFFTIKDEQGILYSKRKMSNYNDCDSIKVGLSYTISLTPISKIELGDGLVFPLNRGALYLNGKVIFEKEDKVFLSTDINGLCLVQH